MKRLGRLWNRICDPENGVAAVIEGTKNKRMQFASRRFLYSDEEVFADPALYHRVDPQKARAYVEKLIPLLRDGTWKPKPPRHKLIFTPNRTKKKGKWRDVYIPPIDDHIIAHMVMQVAMPAFTRGMDAHCCGSVKGRGPKHIVRTISKWTQEDLETRYFVKLDIRKFLDNIDADIMYTKLEEKIKDKYVLDFFDKMLHVAPVACPVGFYTSPYIANLYLEDLDHFVNEDLCKFRRGKRLKLVKHYLRYADDIYMSGTSKSDLKKAVKEVIRYLHENYRLEIKPTWEIKRIGERLRTSDGMKLVPGTYWADIGGYKFCRDATVLRGGIFLSAKHLSRKMAKEETYTVHQCQSLNSRIGWASHCDSGAFMQHEIYPYVNLKETRRVIGNVDKIRKQRNTLPAGI